MGTSLEKVVLRKTRLKFPMKKSDKLSLTSGRCQQVTDRFVMLYCWRSCPAEVARTLWRVDIMMGPILSGQTSYTIDLPIVTEVGMDSRKSDRSHVRCKSDGSHVRCKSDRNYVCCKVRRLLPTSIFDSQSRGNLFLLLHLFFSFCCLFLYLDDE